MAAELMSARSAEQPFALQRLLDAAQDRRHQCCHRVPAVPSSCCSRRVEPVTAALLRAKYLIGASACPPDWPVRRR